MQMTVKYCFNCILIPNVTQLNLIIKFIYVETSSRNIAIPISLLRYSEVSL